MAWWSSVCRGADDSEQTGNLATTGGSAEVTARSGSKDSRGSACCWCWLEDGVQVWQLQELRRRKARPWPGKRKYTDTQKQKGPNQISGRAVTEGWGWMLPNVIIKSCQLLESHFSPNMKNVKSGRGKLIVKLWSRSSRCDRACSHYELQSVVGLFHKQLFTVFHADSRAAPLFTCCRGPVLRWQGWIWMREQLTYECWKEDSTDKFKATSKPLNFCTGGKPVKRFSTTQAITQLKGNIISGPKGPLLKYSWNLYF